MEFLYNKKCNTAIDHRGEFHIPVNNTRICHFNAVASILVVFMEAAVELLCFISGVILDTSSLVD